MHTTLGYVFLNLNDTKEASEELTQGIKPNEIRPLVGLGLTAMRRSRYTEAANFFSLALKNDASHLTSMLNRGILALLRGNTPSDNQEADDALKKFSLVPENTASQYEKRIAKCIKIILTLRGPQRAKGLDQLKIALDKEQDDGQFSFVAAREYRRQGMRDEATAAIRKSLAINPSRPDVALEQAAIFLDLKEFRSCSLRGIKASRA